MDARTAAILRTELRAALELHHCFLYLSVSSKGNYTVAALECKGGRQEVWNYSVCGRKLKRMRESNFVNNWRLYRIEYYKVPGTGAEFASVFQVNPAVLFSLCIAYTRTCRENDWAVLPPFLTKFSNAYSHIECTDSFIQIVFEIENWGSHGWPFLHLFYLFEFRVVAKLSRLPSYNLGKVKEWKAILERLETSYFSWYIEKVHTQTKKPFYAIFNCERV